MQRRTSGLSGQLTSYGDQGFSRFLRRAFAKGMGLGDASLDRPVIGIAQTWSELNPCHAHFRQLAEAVKRGVLLAGGLPREFPTISLGETFLSPTAMLYRNLLAMDTEEMLRAQPLDAVVLLGSCDKTIPAQLMAAASADLPAILLPGGPMLDGHYAGETLGACTDCRRYWTEYRAGRLAEQHLAALEDALAPSAGHCMVMGTASSMACCAEALGMTLPGAAAIPAPLAARYRLAEATGVRAVALAIEDLRPSRILTPAAFDNAIRLLCALGGSTNAVIHLTAIAGRTGLRLTPAHFDALSRATPLLGNLKPAGQFSMSDLYEAGGVPAVLKELEPLLDGACLTVSGRTLAEELAGAARAERRRDVVAALDRPLAAEGGLAAVYGNLAPDGAIIKHAAATPALLRHRGRAVVFASPDDLAARLDDPALAIRADDVLLLQNAGPIGGPGMPEVGNLPIPTRLLQAGVRDMLRISDARMSGTAFGTILLHVSPEAAAGGPLALVRDGDQIDLDVPARTVRVLIDDRELERRHAVLPLRPAPRARGYLALYAGHVQQADRGCDFDFLLPEEAR
ncbi:MAG TPA: dihydroxy-acid dehydratase [Chloroflexota bacterium]|nr:dihydroxy-acid dehydratase [Chloroflexota bacterium]